jgi:transcriptional regulator with XRE-family HTH domain
MALGVDVQGEVIERMRREKLVMNRKEFGKKVGISNSAVWAIERNPQRARPETLRKIAKALGVKPHTLVRVKQASSQ